MPTHRPTTPAAVDALHGRLEEEAAQWRALQTGAGKTSAQLEVRGRGARMVDSWMLGSCSAAAACVAVLRQTPLRRPCLPPSQAVLKRLDGVERHHLPALQAKWEEAATK